MALTEAKDRLSALADEVEREHEIVRVTRHGRTSVIMISESDLDSLNETIYWLSQEGIRDDIAEARRRYHTDSAMSGEAMRVKYGLTP